MTTPRMHRCAAVACPRQVPAHLLMCIEHWRMVPAPLQREVLGAWRSQRYAPGDDAILAHRDAVARAVEAVRTKQQNKLAARQATGGDLFASPGPDASGTD